MNELAARCSTARARAVEQLADVTATWSGCNVPEDPGVAELADELAQAADRLPDHLEGRAEASVSLATAIEHLRAAARLGGLLPLITCNHLRLALQYERNARQALDRTAPSSA